MVNPDGVEYDIATGAYRMWRKNRQPSADRPQPQLVVPVGLLRRLVRHRQLGDLPRPVGLLGAGDAGRAQLRQLARGRRRPADQGAHRLAHLLRADPVAVRLHDRQHGARAHRQRPQRARPARPEHGRHEWLHARAGVRPLHRRRHDQRLDVGVHKIFSYTFEMFPTGSNPGFYPPDEQIGPQTSRNRPAVLQFLEASDCVYEVLGQTCGGPAGRPRSTRTPSRPPTAGRRRRQVTPRPPASGSAAIPPGPTAAASSSSTRR